MSTSSPFGDFFELFKLPRRFAIDPAALEAAYLDVQAKVHPDRFAHLSENERRVSMQWASHANEAYRTLKAPVPRGRYLLELAGFDAEIETNTSMPADFLARQMALREAEEEAREEGDIAALDALLAEIRVEARDLEAALVSDLDQTRELPAAALHLRQLMFLERLREEIRRALETLDS